jgi:SAM-dependent methyltransferase
MELPPTEKFGRRVAAYVAGRPGYPDALFAWLRERVAPGSRVADIGAGTGLFTRGLVDSGYLVDAVEPNEPMRAAFPALGGCSVGAGTAEATGLPARAFGMVTAAQAAHWFDAAAASQEFARILRPGGFVALIWNERVQEGAGAAYQEVVDEFARKVPGARDGREPLPALDLYFDGGAPTPVIFDNPQSVDWDALLARAASSSYMPHPGDDDYPALVERLEAFFREWSRAGRVTIPQETRLFWGSPPTGV